MLGIKKLFSSKRVTPETPYALIGGEQGVKLLANAFYDEMESNIHLRELLAVHQLPLDNIREKFFKYLSGWLGGPPLFEMEYGHPRLRARHLDVKVTKKQSELWMLCMNNALDKTVENKALKGYLSNAFNQLATHMINYPPNVSE